MSTEPTPDEIDEQDNFPPFFKTWNQMYAFVLILHALIILLFYWFTQAYS
ncbi:MAG: hypothetical protein AAFO07_07105 [Bacteroidota bacterium]